MMEFYNVKLEARVGDGTTMDISYLVKALNVEHPENNAIERAIRQHKRMNGPPLTGVHTLRSPR